MLNRQHALVHYYAHCSRRQTQHRTFSKLRLGRLATSRFRQTPAAEAALCATTNNREGAPVHLDRWCLLRVLCMLPSPGLRLTAPTPWLRAVTAHPITRRVHSAGRTNPTPFASATTIVHAGVHRRQMLRLPSGTGASRRGRRVESAGLCAAPPPLQRDVVASHVTHSTVVTALRRLRSSLQSIQKPKSRKFVCRVCSAKQSVRQVRRGKPTATPSGGNQRSQRARPHTLTREND